MHVQVTQVKEPSANELKALSQRIKSLQLKN